MGSGLDREDNPSFDKVYPLKKHAHKPHKNYNGYSDEGKKVKGLRGVGWDWGVHDVVKQTDEYTIDFANQVIQDHPLGDPLFLAVGIFRPHLPFWAPKTNYDKYPMDKLKMPPMPKDDLSDVPPLGVKMSRKESFIWDNTSIKPDDDPGSLKKMVQCYQAASDYCDEMVGRLIDQLDQSGRADNTIIVLWSDHGYHLGDKSATVKFTLWEKANRVPLIIVDPEMKNKGMRCDRPVSLVDIYPTLIDLAALKPRMTLMVKVYYRSLLILIDPGIDRQS